MKYFIFIILFITQSAFGIIRFEVDQLKFTLLETGAGVTSCTHRPLVNSSQAEPPPWWTVECGDREYTVDIWMDLYRSQDQFYNVFLLFHAKESTSSSGEKLAKFNTQTTKLKFKELSPMTSVSMSLDVRNGLADLKVDVSPKK